MIHEFKGYHINIAEVSCIMVETPDPVSNGDEQTGHLKIAVLFAGSSTAKIEISLIPTEIEFKRVQSLLDDYYEYHDLEE